MNKKNQAILSLSFHVGFPLVCAAFLWGFVDYLQEHAEKKPTNYDAFRVAATKEETDKAVKLVLNEKMQACLDDARKRNIAEPFKCVADVQTDPAKIAEAVENRVAYSKAVDQRFDKYMPKLKWALPAIFLFAIALGFGGPVRRDIATIKAHTPQ